MSNWCLLLVLTRSRVHIDRSVLEEIHPIELSNPETLKGYSTAGVSAVLAERPHCLWKSLRYWR